MHRTGRVNQENLSIDHIRIGKSLFLQSETYSQNLQYHIEQQIKNVFKELLNLLVVNYEGLKFLFQYNFLKCMGR